MSHDEVDRRSLAFARLTARRLQENPALLKLAAENIERWLPAASAGARPALQEWRKILDQGLDATVETLLREDEDAARLRQSNPFAGEEFLTRKERADILLEFAETPLRQ